MSWGNNEFNDFMDEANTIGELRTRNEYWNERECCSIQYDHDMIFCDLPMVGKNECILDIVNTLLHHYTTVPYVKELIKGGDIEYLDTTLYNTSQPYSWNRYLKRKYSYNERSCKRYPCLSYKDKRWYIKEYSFSKKHLAKDWLREQTIMTLDVSFPTKKENPSYSIEDAKKKAKKELSIVSKKSQPRKEEKKMFHNIHLVHDMTEEIANRICKAVEQRSQYCFRTVQNVKNNLTVMVSPKNQKDTAYTVVFTPHSVNCSCPDHTYRETDTHPLPCKHIFMVQFHTGWKPPVKEKK